jgi:uncharacterized paraquat-inducible protein A
MFLVFASSYSFLSLSRSGVESNITLLQTPAALWSYGILINQGRYHSWLVPLAKGVFLGQHWSMVEVFIIAVIVALVKIAAMATVVIGISFWAYAAFTVCFTLAVSSLDRYQCWERIEALKAQ